MIGLGRMIELILRRERIKLPIWVAVITVFVPYFFTVLDTFFTTMSPDQIELFGHHPLMKMFGGPGYGLDQMTVERFFIAGYGPEFLLGAALMNMLLIIRHTRAEEQTGRAELIRATVVARHAGLTAALLVALLTDTVLALLLAVAAMGMGLPFASALLFGVGVGATGLVFAGAAAITAQVTEHSRAAGGLAAAALGIAWIIRAIGDLIGEHGSPLSWLSPLAWPQQTRVLVNERWWPLILSAACAAAMVAVAYALAARRDFGAGVVRPRPGPTTAPHWLGSPLTLAWQLRRTEMLRWAIPLLVAGLVFGGLAGPMDDALTALPEQLVPGGESAEVLDAYFALMVVGFSFIVGIYTVLSIHSLRTDENRGLLDPVLATATTRSQWVRAHLMISAIAGVAFLTLVGVAGGAAAALTTGDAPLIGMVTLDHLVRAPEVLALLTIAAALYGMSPRTLPISWLVLLYGVIMRWFTPRTGWPSWLADLSPFQHIPRMPLESFAALPVVALIVLAFTLAALGLYTIRRRDIRP
ncbi:ABC transporter permease [Nocardia carnea]|uniref:ABC transporter permease n=1 Tax=Nocardia carnea TaxID=37328 RepID=UPI002454B3F5|nr:ABC transporter permease [Nocardia carnea]